MCPSEILISPRSPCGRADLVRAIGAADPSLLPVVADLLGYERVEAPHHRPKTPTATVAKSSPSSESVVFEAAHPGEPSPLRETPFWRIIAYQARDYQHDDQKRSPAPPLVSGLASKRPPRRETPAIAKPLAPWSELLPRLRRAATKIEETRQLDVKRLLKQIGRGELLSRLPRQTRRRWGEELHVIVDRSLRLTPFWSDQNYVCTHLERLLLRTGLVIARKDDGAAHLLREAENGNSTPYAPAPPGVLVLVLGDLGCLDHAGSSDRRFWLRFGKQLSQNGNPAVALTPCPPHRWSAEIGRYWRMTPWEKQTAAVMLEAAGQSDAVAPAERLLWLLSPAGSRIEPGLLRDVRRLPELGWLGADVEADVWRHPAVSSGSYVGAALDPQAAKTFQKRFEEQGESLKRKVLALIHHWREHLPPEIWQAELLALSEATRQLAPHPDDFADACAFVEEILAELDESSEGKLSPSLLAKLSWVWRLTGRLSDGSFADPQIGKTLRQLWFMTRRDDPQSKAPSSLDPSEADDEDAPERSYRLLQRGPSLTVLSSDSPHSRVFDGSYFGSVRCRNGMIVIAGEAFWRTTPPSWASHWGRDRLGGWVEFEINSVRQRMRWIPAGSFWMGSPGDEPGRDEREGPQHKVTLTQGFWLFDTPCTQALWEVVMGDNPSEFKSPNRPVESVSWDDCQKFLTKLNEQAPDLNLSLPNEAQWEYACRAGTSGAIYQGEFEILGENNAPALDPIAWYGGNSGVDFELDNGWDSSDWEEKQYSHTKAGTHPVKRKAPNPWGLYDMLGNVDEWCHDDMREYSDKPQVDPTAPEAAASARVLRGGAWYYCARGVRAAYRFACEPGLPQHQHRLSLCSSSGRSGAGEAAGGGACGAATRRRLARRSGASASGLNKSRIMRTSKRPAHHYYNRLRTSHCGPNDASAMGELNRP